jgi:hypothetical protein
MKYAHRVFMGLAAGAILAAGGAGRADATVINVKFESQYPSFQPNVTYAAGLDAAYPTAPTASAYYSGQGALSDANNNFWNAAPVGASYTVTGATASDGVTATTVKVAATGGGGFVDFSSNLSRTSTQNLLGSYTDGVGTFTISGLPTNVEYALYLYGGAEAFTVAGGTADNGIATTTTNVSAQGNTGSLGAEGASWVLFTGNTGDTGQVTGTDSVNLSGLQISFGTAAAPEPASLGLLGLGGLALLVRRRK